MKSEESVVCSTVDSVFPCPCSPISSFSPFSSPSTSTSVFPLFSSLPDPISTSRVEPTIDLCHPFSSLGQHSNVIPFTTFTGSDPYWWKEAHSHISMFDGILSGGLASKEDLLEIGFSPLELHSATHVLPSSPLTTGVSPYPYKVRNLETGAKLTKGAHCPGNVHSASAEHPVLSSSYPLSFSHRVSVEAEEVVPHPHLSSSSSLIALESPHPAAQPNPYFFVSSASSSPSALPPSLPSPSPSTFLSTTAEEGEGRSASATRLAFAQTSSGPRVVSACAEELSRIGALKGRLSCTASAYSNRANSSSSISPSPSVGSTQGSTASSVVVSPRKRSSDVLSREEEECSGWKRERGWWDPSGFCTTVNTDARFDVPDEVACGKAFTSSLSRSRIWWDHRHRGALLGKVSRGGGASMNSASLPSGEAEGSEMEFSSRASSSALAEQSHFSSCRNDDFHNTALLFNGADYCPFGEY